MREETNIAGNIGKIFKITSRGTGCVCYCMLTQVDLCEYKLITIKGGLVGNRFTDQTFKSFGDYNGNISCLKNYLDKEGFYFEITNKKLTLK